MIQRVQSLFLLAVSVLTALMFYFPFMEITQQENIIYALNFNGFAAVDGSVIASMWPLAGLIIFCMLIALASIFFFKKRKLQIKMNIFNIILFLLIYVVILIYFFMHKSDLQVTDYSFGISSLLPVLNIILTYLAIRAIGADEAMVSSLNRLR